MTLTFLPGDKSRVGSFDLCDNIVTGKEALGWGSQRGPTPFLLKGDSAGASWHLPLPCLFLLGSPTLHDETWLLAADQMPDILPASFMFFLLPELMVFLIAVTKYLRRSR